MERRQFTRKTVDLPVVCESYDLPGNRVTGKAIDISQGGVGIKFDKPFKGQGVVRVMLSNSSSWVNIEAEGKVAWHQTLQSGEDRMGINFTKQAWWMNDLIGQE